MNIDLQAARNYGDALFGAAKAAGVVEQIWSESHVLSEVCAANPRFVAFIEAPNVPTEEKASLAEKVLGGRFHRLLKNFVLLLLKRGRVTIFRAALDEYHRLAMKDLGKSEGVVHTASPLSEEERNRLRAALERSTGLRLEIKYQVDPSLIGGVVFKAGDLLIDNSLKMRLARLKENMMAARVN